ncbi:MAG: hypothetical protein IJP28_04540 [Erysipelotrichales bacterium]|nr:hypothetical protein [Erysipelotrichales bacterium]
MGFISYSLSYYSIQLEYLENTPVTVENIYHAKQLLKMLDDLIDEGYTSLYDRLEASYHGVSRLHAYIEKNGEHPFEVIPTIGRDKVYEYSKEVYSLKDILDDVFSREKGDISDEPFLEELIRYCEWIGYEKDTAYIFLLRDTLLPYIYYRSLHREHLYPWLLSRKALVALSGVEDVDDEIRLALYNTLEAKEYSSSDDFFDQVCKRIRSTVEAYPTIVECVTSLLGSIGEKKIVVIESGYCGTIPLLLKSLDDRVDLRMYTAATYLRDLYRDKIYTPRFEDIRLFETLYSQDLFIRFYSIADHTFLVKKCIDPVVEEKALAEINKMKV